MEAITLPPLEPSLDERGRLLAQAIEYEVARGYRMIDQSATTAKLTKHRKPDHVGCANLTFWTAGFYLPVWLLETLFDRSFMSTSVVSLEIDGYGNFNRSQRKSIRILVDRLRAVRATRSRR